MGGVTYPQEQQKAEQPSADDAASQPAHSGTPHSRSVSSDLIDSAVVDSDLDTSTSTEADEDVNPHLLPPSPAQADSPEHVDRATVLGQDGRWLAAWSLRFIIMVAAGFILWKILGMVWVGLLPVILAILVTSVLQPAVSWLKAKNWPNALSATTVLLGFFLIIGGIVAAIAPSVVNSFPTLIEQGNQGVRQVLEYLQNSPITLDTETIQRAFDEVTSWLQSRYSQIASGVFSGISTATSIVITLVVVLLLTFFFLKDGGGFLPMVRRYTGPTVGWHLTEVLSRTWVTLGGFIRAQATVSAIDAVIIGIGLIILGVPLAWALAVFTFLCGFIPYVGAFLSGALTVFVALVSGGLTEGIWALVLVLAVQQLEGNVLSPIIQSKAMSLHPVVVLLSVTIGGTLFGVLGAFLAVPVAATIAVWLRYHAELVGLRSGDLSLDDIEMKSLEYTSSDNKNTLNALKENLAKLRPAHLKGASQRED